ncbi:MAG: carboxymuconolactone decarboxylase family protein [Solirubrobacterales bacterium]
MTEVEFQNRRFDPDLTPFHDLAKSMAKAFGYTADLEIDAELAQLLRLRVAQSNNCSYCLILHTETARERGIDPARVDGLGSWWESSLYTEPERAALAYCDVLNEGDQPGFQATHDALAEHFSERGIAEIAAIVINMNVWTRLKLAQGATPTFA